MLKKRFSLMIPVLETAMHSPAAFMRTSFKTGQLRTSTTSSKVLRVEGEKAGLTIAAFNLLSCFGPTDNLADTKSSAGMPIWREDDAVHLTVAAYGDVAAILSSHAEANGKIPTQEEAGQHYDDNWSC